MGYLEGTIEIIRHNKIRRNKNCSGCGTDVESCRAETINVVLVYGKDGSGDDMARRGKT